MRIVLSRPAESENDPYPFGDSRVAELMVAALRLAGHDVEAITTTEPGSGRPIDIETARVVADLTSSGPRPDVWISSQIDDFSGEGMGRAVSTALDIPHILLQPRIYQSADAAGGKSTIPLQAIAAADATFAMSNAYAAKIAEALPDYGDRLIVLSPFIDFDAVVPAIENRQTSRTLLALRHQLPTDVPWLIAAGPLATNDDLDSFRLLAQAMTPLSNLKWYLIIVGAGSRGAEVAPLFGRMPVRCQRLLTVRTQAELLTLLACGDLFIWPSNDERLPLPAIEAQAAGLPVVAGKTAAMQDVVDDGRTGMLIKPGNAPSLSNAIRFLLSRPEFRRIYAQQGSKWAAQYFDMRAIVSQLDAALHQVVRRAGPHDTPRPIQAAD